MSIDKLNPADLNKRGGHGAKKGDAVLTSAERQRKWRRKYGGRTINTTLTPDIAACFLYLRQQWGMKSDRETMEAAIRFLTVCTRSGLTRIPQAMDD